MTTGLRRTLLAAAGLFVIGGVLLFRLNSADLSQHFYEQFSKVTDATLTAKRSELTLIHGIGLRLDEVSLTHRQYRMQAGHMNISLGLLPLLLGKIEVNTLDIHDASLTIDPESLQLTSTAISSLPVKRIHLIRSRILTPDGRELLNNLHMELRNIGPNRETLWELNARQGKQSIGGNGRLLFHAGEIAAGFGKLKFHRLRLDDLQPFAPATLIAWLENKGQFVSGALTLDIPKQYVWSVFGSVELKNDSGETTLNLRGKLDHPDEGKLHWHDSFINIGEQAVLAINGNCEKNDCHTSLNAKQVPVSEWFSFLPDNLKFPRNITGMSNLNADIGWNQKTWHGHAALQLTDTSFRNGDNHIPLPDLKLLAEEFSGSTTQWHAKASISTTQDSGIINISSSQTANGSKDLFITTDAADAELWQPLSNLLLTSLGMSPTLKAKGPLNGILHLHQQNAEKSLEVEIDATPAEVVYPSWFEKPQNIAALCRIKVGFSEDSPTSVNLQQCRLDESSVKQLHWSIKNGRHQLNWDQLELNLEQIRKLSIHLPESMAELNGIIKGSGHTSRKNHGTDWFSDMSAQWQLQQLGTTAWHADGAIDVKHGIASSAHFLINSSSVQLELKGSYDISKQHGNVDITAGKLDWDTTFPDGLKNISLNGHIEHTELTLLNNHWYDIQTDYEFTGAKLTLHGLQSILADGMFSSKQLEFSSAIPSTTDGDATHHSDGSYVQGDIRAENIRLHKLRGLADLFQADIDGKLHANIKLNGYLPRSDLAAWQYSNGDILIYNGNWKQRLQSENIKQTKPATTKPRGYAFRQLGFRFHIHRKTADLSHISLVHHQQQYLGQASITPDFHIRGHVHHKADATDYFIDSTLPEIRWELLKKAP